MVGGSKTVGDLPYNRGVTHLHGGFTPWFSDGTPYQWFDPSGSTGANFMNVPGTDPAAGSEHYGGYEKIWAKDRQRAASVRT